MGTELTRQIRRLRHGDHSCLLYDDPAEQRAAMVPFFQEGLARGERCLYIADDRTADEVRAFLTEAGIDVAAETRRGAFQVLTKRDTYLKDGAFDPVAMIDVLGETLERTLSEGYAGLRGSGEMTWALGAEKGCDRVIEYEALLNDFFPGRSFVAICQYNRRRFLPGVALDVLRTHHYAVLGEHVCPNLYYEPTQMVLGQPSPEALLDWRIRQLKLARDAVDGLEQTILAREAFFSVASHELRTPLTSMKLLVQVARRQLDRTHPESPVSGQLERVLGQVAHLEDLIQRLLDVNLLSRQPLSLTRAPLDLAELVRAVLARHRTAAAQSRCTLELDAVSVVGSWDRGRIEQVIDNLIHNALKYGAGKPVHIDVRPQGSSAILRVRDHGIGIDPVDQGRIFGPFERAVSGRNYSGFGVGLWAVDRIITAHGGSIGVDSALGQGATFTVNLPAASETAAPSSTASGTWA